MQGTCKYILTMGLALAVCLLACCGSLPDSEALSDTGSDVALLDVPPTADTVIILRHDGAEDSITHMGALRFKGELEALSQGSMRVDVYPANKLGNRLDTEYALRYGTVTMHMGEPLYVTLQCLAWTPLAGSIEVYRERIRAGQVRERIDAECVDAGVLFLGTVSEEYQVISSTRPIESPEDFTGLRIASIGRQSSEAFWNALGATVVQSQRRQFYTAIQQGLVDAVEDTVYYDLAERYNRHHPYITLTNHRIASRAVYIHKRFYSELPPDQQEMVDAAVDETSRYLGEYIDSSQQEVFRLLGEQNRTVRELSAAEQEQLWERVRGPLTVNLRASFGEQPVDALLEALAA